MSAEPTLVTAAHFDYVRDHTRAEDDFLVALKRAAADDGIPPIWISPAQASLMQILLRLGGTRDVVEVGTLAGYSAIAMARALPEDGRVTTIEVDAKHAAFARRWIADSDVADKIDVIEGRGDDVLATLGDGTADACFLDADKSGYAGYLDALRRILRPGALVMADNAFAFGELFAEEPSDPEVPAVRAFNDHVAAQSWLQAAIVPIGDGLWVGVALDD